MLQFSFQLCHYCSFYPKPAESPPADQVIWSPPALRKIKSYSDALSELSSFRPSVPSLCSVSLSWSSCWQ